MMMYKHTAEIQLQSPRRSITPSRFRHSHLRERPNAALSINGSSDITLISDRCTRHRMYHLRGKDDPQSEVDGATYRIGRTTAVVDRNRTKLRGSTFRDGKASKRHRSRRCDQMTLQALSAACAGNREQLQCGKLSPRRPLNALLEKINELPPMLTVCSTGREHDTSTNRLIIQLISRRPLAPELP